MTHLKNAAAALILGFAAAGALASPALAQTQAGTLAGHAAHAQASPGAIEPDDWMTPHRASAMRACNDLANRLAQPTYGNMQSYQYWSCMQGRGEHD